MQEQATRDRVAEDTESVKARAKETYLKLEQAEKEQADAVALKRHLQEQLEIISAEDQEKKEVALKAEAIAHRMEEMVAKADGAWHEVQQAKKTAAAGFEEAKTTVKATSAAEAKAQKEEQEAEDSAQLASSKLAMADQEVQRLLKVAHLPLFARGMSRLDRVRRPRASCYVLTETLKSVSICAYRWMHATETPKAGGPADGGGREANDAFSRCLQAGRSAAEGL